MTLVSTVRRLFGVDEDPAAAASKIADRLPGLRAELAEAEAGLAVAESEQAAENAESLLDGKPLGKPSKSVDDQRAKVAALRAAIASLEATHAAARQAHRASVIANAIARVEAAKGYVVKRHADYMRALLVAARVLHDDPKAAEAMAVRLYALKPNLDDDRARISGIVSEAAAIIGEDRKALAPEVIGTAAYHALGLGLTAEDALAAASPAKAG